MLKILQARLLQSMNHELPDVQAGFRKGRGTRDQIANICWIMEKTRESRKTSIYALLTMPKPLTVWITINCGKFWKRWEYQITWSASWETGMQVRKQQLELDMKQQTGSKLGKSTSRVLLCLLVFVLCIELLLCWVHRYLQLLCLPLGLIPWSLCSILPRKYLVVILTCISR